MICTVFMFICCVHAYRDFPKFYFYDAVAGMAWTAGNSLTIPISQTIGMNLGVIIWSCSAMLTGWATGMTGIFGNNPQSTVVTSWALNIAGIILATVACITALFIKSDRNTIQTRESDDMSLPNFHSNYDTLINPTYSSYSVTSTDKYFHQETDYHAHKDDHYHTNTVTHVEEEGRTTTQKIQGVLLALLAGVLFGINCNFVQRVCDTEPGASQNVLDHVLGFFIGSLLIAFSFFIIHCGIEFMRDKAPQVNPKITFPSFLSGIICVIAQLGFFIANGEFSPVITWPVLAIVSSLTTMLWSLWYYKEIRGRGNYLIVCLFFIFTVASSTMSLMSRLKA